MLITFENKASIKKLRAFVACGFFVCFPCLDTQNMLPRSDKGFFYFTTMNIFEKIDFLLAPKPDDFVVFHGGETITKEIIEHLQKYPRSCIQKLFKGKVYYEIELTCNECKDDYIVSEVIKARLEEYIFDGRFVCSECINKVIQKRIELQNELRKEVLEATQNFIDVILNPKASFNENIKQKEYFNIVKKETFRCNQNTIFEYAAKMPYYDFLKTPYWAAVRYKVMQMANFKCSLCNVNGNLAVHHRSYENRGYEMQTQKDLICLCDNCHKKFHDKL